MFNYDTLDAIIDHCVFNRDVSITDVNTAFPKNVFGCFVTVLRSDNNTKHKNTKSDSVHGCIGFWNKDFGTIDNTELFNTLLRVGYDAVNTDRRKDNFKDLLCADLNATVEITYMIQNPEVKSKIKLSVVDKSTGHVGDSDRVMFDNNKLGLIVQDDTSGSRATFLPKVFSASSWKQISSLLVEKAGINSPENVNVRFYAYKGVVLERRIVDRFVKPYLSFVDLHYKKCLDVPYYLTSANKITFKPDEYVRNTATVRDLCILLNNGYQISDHVKECIDKYVADMVRLFSSEPDKIRQSLPFLLMCLKGNDTYRDVTIKIVRYLISEINTIRETDPNFEYGEVLSGIGLIVDDVSAPIKSEIVKLLIDQLEFLSNLVTSLDVNNPNSVFCLNWIAQAVRAIYMSVVPDASLFRTHKKDLSVVTDNLTKKLSQVVRRFSSHSESNYLCVALEGITAIHSIMKSTHNELLNIQQIMYKLLNLIVTRVNSYGLVNFVSGDARIDITGHFLNSLMILTDGDKKQMVGGGLHFVTIDSHPSLAIYKENKQRYIDLAFGNILCDR